MFMGSYGITQIVIVWVNGSPDTAMGFGQMVPLFLLFLPMLAVIEIASGKHNGDGNADITLISITEIPSKIQHENLEMNNLCESPSSLSATFDMASEHEHPSSPLRSSTVEITRAEEGFVRRRTTTHDPTDNDIDGPSVASHAQISTSVTNAPSPVTPTTSSNPGHASIGQGPIATDSYEAYISKMYDYPGFRSDIVFAGLYMLMVAVLGGALCGGALSQGNENIQIFFNAFLGLYMVSGVVTLAYRITLILLPRLREGSIRPRIQ
jgi:hypothetical protein